MSRVDKMQQAGNSPMVKFIELSRIFGKSKSLWACVFEGEDEKYFASRLNFYLGDGMWSGVASGGKKNAIDLHAFISSHPEYKNHRYAFFADRDYEDWLSSPDEATFYITEVYSIENLYVSSDVLKSILSAEFGIAEHNDEFGDFAKCMSLFENAFNQFCSCVSAFNYFAKAHRIMERDGKKAGSLNIRNIKISDLVSIDLAKVQANYDVNAPESLFKDLAGLALDEDAWNESVATLPPETWAKRFRGKQQIEFLRTFLSQLKMDRCSATPKIFSKKGNVKLGLSKENCISELSQYALTPKCLRDFLSILEQRPVPI